MTKKTRLIIYSGVTLAVLLVSALFPLKFLNRTSLPTNGTPLDISQRADLFDLYWRNANGGFFFSMLDFDARSDLSESRGKIDGLLEDIAMDEAQGIVSSEGNEYFELVSVEGSTMRIWHTWSEWSGDWKNWFDVYIDIDTLDIYYMYFSSESLSKPTVYLRDPFEYKNAMSAAEQWQTVCGYELIGVSWTGEPTDTAASIYFFNNEAIHYGINCIYHPGVLFDIRILING